MPRVLPDLGNHLTKLLAGVQEMSEANLEANIVLADPWCIQVGTYAFTVVVSILGWNHAAFSISA